MKKIYYLSTCDTCKRIIRELGGGAGFEMQDIKEEPLQAGQLEELSALAGSYENLFSRRARKYRAMGLHEKELSEKDYRGLLLAEYTFLKRPVILIDGEIFVGNSQKVVAAAKAKL